MKQVYSYQEAANLIESGQVVKFIYPLRVEVTATKKLEGSTALHVTFVLIVGEYAIGEFASEYDSIEALLDAFDIADHQEVFEMLAKQG